VSGSRLRNPYLWAFVVGCVTVTLIRPLLPPRAPSATRPRAIAEVLAVGAGRPAVCSEELRGHVYVASFFFHPLRLDLPPLMKQLGRLERRYREDGFDSIRLVSISVDPDYDTPERLREAEGRYTVGPLALVLLTGSRDEIPQPRVDGFKLALGEAATAAGETIDIAHSGKLVLVDPEGAVRGLLRFDRRRPRRGVLALAARAQGSRREVLTPCRVNAPGSCS